MFVRNRNLLVLAILVALLGLFLTSSTAVAHNTYNGGYRRFPWVGDTVQTLTTLPNQAPHSGEFNQLAIDVGMNFATVYSISNGTFVEFVDRYCYGNTLTVQDNDGSYIIYAHLDPSVTPTSGVKLIGYSMAKSGNSTGGGGTACSSAAHLHFARYSSAPTFTMDDRNRQASLEPISGHGDGIDALCNCGYTSDNAGPGLQSNGSLSLSHILRYYNLGEYNWGVTAMLGSAWSPCRASLAPNTWWLYICNPASWANGTVQTYKGPSERQRAIMSSSDGTHALFKGILAAYTEILSGQDWVYWIGYPTSDRVVISVSPLVFQQTFKSGSVNFFASSCKEDMYQYGVYITSYFFCD